jgi:hypothetical protein
MMQRQIVAGVFHLRRSAEDGIRTHADRMVHGLSRPAR